MAQKGRTEERKCKRKKTKTERKVSNFCSRNILYMEVFRISETMVSEVICSVLCPQYKIWNCSIFENLHEQKIQSFYISLALYTDITLFLYVQREVWHKQG